LIPQNEGDASKERTVRISGDKRQIDIATALIKDVMYQVCLLMFFLWTMSLLLVFATM